MLEWVAAGRAMGCDVPVRMVFDFRWRQPVRGTLPEAGDAASGDATKAGGEARRAEDTDHRHRLPIATQSNADQWTPVAQRIEA